MIIDLDAKLLGMSVLELVAAGLVLVNVGLTVRQNILCWPVGAVAVALYGVFFYRERLYANAGLQVVFFVLQFYSWYEWLYGGEQRTRLLVQRASLWQLLWLSLAGVAGAGSLGFGLSRQTDASLSLVDAVTTAFSLVAQWMLARKLLENWLFWIGVDVLYVGMFLWNGNFPSMVLYGTLLSLAVLGYLDWTRSYRERKPA